MSIRYSSPLSISDALTTELRAQRTRHGLPLSLCLAALLTGAVDCVAATTATSTVSADWDSSGSLFWTSDSGQLLTWGAGFDFSASSVAQTEVRVNDVLKDSDSAFDFSWRTLGITSSYSGAEGTLSASGSTNDTAMAANASATPLAGMSDRRLEARGYAAHAGRFTVGGAGNITLSFPYQYQLEVQKARSEDGAFAGISGFLSLDNYGPTPATNTPPYTPLTSVYQFGEQQQAGLGIGDTQLAKSVSGTGMMTLTLFFNDGDKGYFALGFTGDAYGYTAPDVVPLPSALGLMLAGVVGVAATALRRGRPGA
jgi:hypothetical protein